MRVSLIIAAGGRGIRAGLRVPKQFAEINGRTVLSLTVDPFLRFEDIDEIIVSSRDEYMTPAGSGVGCMEKLRFVRGGETRMESVANALFSIPSDDRRAVMIHDAVRPCLSTNLITRVISALREEIDGVIPVIPLYDSLKAVSREAVSVLKTIKRGEIVAAQTPQIFWLERLKGFFARVLESYEKESLAEIQDDSQVVEICGGRVSCVAGEGDNIKITLAEDLEIAEKIIASRYS